MEMYTNLHKSMFLVGFSGLEGAVWKLLGFKFGAWRLLGVWLGSAGCDLEAWWLDVGGWGAGGGRSPGGVRGFPLTQVSGSGLAGSRRGTRTRHRALKSSDPIERNRFLPGQAQNYAHWVHFGSLKHRFGDILG